MTNELCTGYLVRSKIGVAAHRALRAAVGYIDGVACLCPPFARFGSNARAASSSSSPFQGWREDGAALVAGCAPSLSVRASFGEGSKSLEFCERKVSVVYCMGKQGGGIWESPRRTFSRQRVCVFVLRIALRAQEVFP